MKSTIQVEEDGDGGRGRQQQQQQPLFLLGTPYPTNVDAVLFAHLAEALTDVHVYYQKSLNMKHSWISYKSYSIPTLALTIDSIKCVWKNL